MGQFVGPGFVVHISMPHVDAAKCIEQCVEFSLLYFLFLSDTLKNHFYCILV